MASRRSSRGASALERSVATSSQRGTSKFGGSSSSASAAPPLDDEALYLGWCRIGQPNGYRGPEDSERNDLAEGQGGRNHRRGVSARQSRLRKERQRQRRAEQQHAEQQQQEQQPSRAEAQDHVAPSQDGLQKRRINQQRRRAASAAARAEPAVPAEDADHIMCDNLMAHVAALDTASVPSERMCGHVCDCVCDHGLFHLRSSQERGDHGHRSEVTTASGAFCAFGGNTVVCLCAMRLVTIRVRVLLRSLRV